MIAWWSHLNIHELLCIFTDLGVCVVLLPNSYCFEPNRVYLYMCCIHAYTTALQYYLFYKVSRRNLLVRQMDRQAGRQTDRQAGRQTDRQAGRRTGWQARWQTDRQTGRQTDRQTGSQADRQTCRQTDKQAPRQTGWQSDRQADRQIGRQTHKHACMQTDRQAGTELDINLITDHWTAYTI